MKTFERIIATTLFTLLLLLCSVRALGQSSGYQGHPEHAKQTDLAQEKSLLESSTVTAAHGEAEKFRLPVVLHIDQSDLGAAARANRVAHASLPRARATVSQDDHGRLVSVANPNATTDLWLYGRSQ